MKKRGMLLILLVAVMLTAILITGCSKKAEDKPVAGNTSANTENSADRTDESGNKVKIDTADGKVEVENKGGDSNVDVKVAGEEGETSVKGSSKDGDIDINVAGPDGMVKIKGTNRGDKHVVNVEGIGGSVKVTSEGDKSEAVVEGVDGVSKVSVNKSVKESDFDIKFFPGSTIVEGTVSEVPGPGGKAIKTKNVTLNCSGELADIKKFYVDQFDNPTVVEDENEANITTGNPAAGKNIVVTIRKSDEGKVEVNIISHDMNM